jgi:hypothetical protein
MIELFKTETLLFSALTDEVKDKTAWEDRENE